MLVSKEINKIKKNILNFLKQPLTCVGHYDNIIIERHNRKEIMKANKKMGRPLTSDKPRTIRFAVRLDEKEHQELKEKAAKNGMGMAEYIRYLIKNSK